MRDCQPTRPPVKLKTMEKDGREAIGGETEMQYPKFQTGVTLKERGSHPLRITAPVHPDLATGAMLKH